MLDAVPTPVHYVHLPADGRTYETSMANIARVLREEILRLSRKETRSQTIGTKKAAAQHRHDIAALKRQVADLQRQVNLLLSRASKGGASHAHTAGTNGTRIRFVAKGLRSHRTRLGLSAGDFGKLVGASANSVYAWETGKTVPRREQIAKIAVVRAMGKKEAAQRLARG